MKTRFFRVVSLISMLLICLCPVLAQAHRQKPDECQDTSNMTQGEMNDCALKDLRQAESELQRLLKQLGIASDSPEQKAWEAYRDAPLAALYPPQDVSSYGSVYPMCLAVLQKALTQGRIRDLKALTTKGEGDVCYGYQASARKGR